MPRPESKPRMKIRLLALMPLLVVAAACATSSATGGSPSPSPSESSVGRTNLTVVIEPGFIANPTPRTYHLTCQPPGGTVSDPAAACAALPAAASLLAPHTPCVRPDTGGEDIVGTFQGRSVDVKLGGCDEDRALWQRLVMVLGIPS